jgi:hypothetical protein
MTSGDVQGRFNQDIYGPGAALPSCAFTMAVTWAGNRKYA